MSSKWMNNALSQFSAETQELFSGAKDAYRLYAEAKERAERAAIRELHEAGLPQSQTAIFNYRFGGVSFMIAAKEERKATTVAKPKISLGEFLRQQQNSGHAV